MSGRPLKILVYVDSFRHRDLWPMVDHLCSEGHSVYYQLSHPGGIAEVVRVDARHGFDIAISGDRRLTVQDTPELFAALPSRPKVLKLIFNDLPYVERRYGSLSLDEQLQRENGWLVVMDSGLHTTLQSLGTERSRLLRFGVPVKRIDRADYQRLRWGRRARGWQPRHSTVSRVLGAVRQRLRGFTAGPRPTDIVFLGECDYGRSEEALDAAAISMRDLLPPSDVHRIARDFDSAFPRLVASSVDAVARVLDVELLAHVHEAAGESNARRGAVALFRARLLTQFRTFRRLQLVRDLSWHYGERFVLIGDDFRRLGLPAQPTSYRDAETYWRAKVAIDFGSNVYDCSIHPRVARIISCAACIIQRAQFDADEIWGTTAPRRTFDDSSAMIASLDRVLGDESERAALVDAQERLATTTASWRTSFQSLLDTLPGREPQRAS